MKNIYVYMYIDNLWKNYMNKKKYNYWLLLKIKNS
jgi:hypothetical protein